MTALRQFSIAGQDFKLNRSYTPIKKIGEGAYGIVCAATDDATQEKVAIKRVKPMGRDEWECRHTLREITIMRLCDSHPNIISLKGLSVNQADDELYIIMDLMFSDLYRILKHVRHLNTGQIKVILKQILMGLEALHTIGIIHRDLKPGNLLLTKECQVCISDFGLARFFRDAKGHTKRASITPEDSSWDAGAVTMTQYVVTRWYRCPELLLAPHLPYATAVDIWSVGCIFAEMLMGEALFPGNSNPDQVRRILRVLGTPADGDYGFELHPEAQRFLEREPAYRGQPFQAVIPNATQDALDLLQGLLALDPAKRISVHQALTHPYLSDCPPCPGGELSLADFLQKWKMHDVGLDFERKDATLEYLRGQILREVGRYNDRGVRGGDEEREDKEDEEGAKAKGVIVQRRGVTPYGHTKAESRGDWRDGMMNGHQRRVSSHKGESDEKDTEVMDSGDAKGDRRGSRSSMERLSGMVRGMVGQERRRSSLEGSDVKGVVRSHVSVSHRP